MRTTSPPVPRPLWSAPAHSERIGAALSSPKTSTPRGTRVSTPARSTWPGRENHSPHPEFLKIADGNQYNKLLENDEKTEQELSPERIQYSKLLTVTTSSLFQVLNRAYYEVRERSVILVLDAVVYRTEFRQQPCNLQQNRAWAVVSPLGPRRPCLGRCPDTTGRAGLR